MDSKNKVSCPACSSSDVTIEKVEKDITLPHGKVKKIFIDEYTCSVCGMQGDFAGTNDKAISEAYDDADKEIVYNIIDDLARQKNSMAAVERALDLPQRTITKWKNGLSHPSATGVALMKMVGTFPWLLDVADVNYDPLLSKKIFIKNSVDALVDLTVTLRAGINLNAGEMVQASGVIIYYKVRAVNEGTSVQAQQYSQISSSGISSLAHVILSK